MQNNKIAKEEGNFPLEITFCFFAEKPSQSLRDSSPKGGAKSVRSRNLYGSYFEKTIPQSAALPASFAEKPVFQQSL
jgi:hypothetical protein